MQDLTSNRISYVLNAEEFSAAKSHLQKLYESLHFMVKLTPKETDLFYRISDADKNFMRNCLMEMNSAGDLLPPFVKPEEVVKDLTCGDQLLELENSVTELLEHIRRNRRLVNHEAYTTTSMFYHTIGSAARAGMAQARAMYERMQSYHVNQKRNARSAAAKAAQKKELVED